MRKQWHFVVAATFALGITSALARAQQAPCKRPAKKQFREGDTVVVAQPRALPCDIAVVDLPVELRADDAGVVANMGTQVLRLIDGRFLTSTGRGEISLWAADGKFVKNVGRTGQGPGEYGMGGMSLHQDPKGSIYVRDNNMRWTILTPQLEFVRQLSAVGVAFDPRRSVFLDDGRYLGAPSLGPLSSVQSFFQMYDFSQTAPPDNSAAPPPPPGRMPSGPGPARGAAFGSIPDDEKAIRAARAERFIGYAGGSIFWAGPPNDVGRGYELELWSTAGKKLRTIRRDATWFAKGSDVAPPPTGSEGTPIKPTTQITGLHFDNNGLLYVTAVAITDRWKPVSIQDRAAYAANINNAFDLYFEVIDVDAGVLLASRGPLTREQTLAQLPVGFFRGTAQGFRISDNADGLPGRRIVELKLVAK